MVLLVVVSDVHVGAEAHSAGKRRELPDDDFQKGRFAGSVVADDSGVFSALNVKGNVIKKALVLKAHGQMPHLHDIPSGTNAGL